jgi:hypothetical protein
MTKLRFFAVVALVAATAIMFTSCSKEKKLEGKWKITKSSTSESGYDFSEAKGESWSFKDNGKCSVHITWTSSYKRDYDGTFSVSGNTLSIDLDKDSYGDKVDGEFDIDELSSKELSISGTWTIKEEGYNPGKVKCSYDFEKK